MSATYNSKQGAHYLGCSHVLSAAVYLRIKSQWKKNQNEFIFSDTSSWK